MKRLLVLIALLTWFGNSDGQISLQDCYKMARENYPNLKQTELWEEITNLKKENLRTNYYPQVKLNAQTTYQSDVTHIDPGIPGLSIPKVSADQYKAYAEIRQNIWDGGISAANAKLEDAVLKNNLSTLEVEVFKINEQVAQAFFTSYLLEKQKEVLREQKVVLNEKLGLVNSGVKNGVSEPASALVLKAEILALEQQEIQLLFAQNAALQMLSILTGKEITAPSDLRYKDNITLSTEINRPELVLFSNQKQQLSSQIELLNKTRNPQLFGFGQAGLGKPGLNMLNDKADTYFLVGLGVSWNAFDWKTTQRKKQVLQQSQQIVDHKEATFRQNLNILLAQQKEQINKIQALMLNDEQMISLRQEITRAAASKLENEAITASDYVREVQAETIAKLNFEIHKIQLNETKEKYNLVQGHPVSTSIHP